MRRCHVCNAEVRSDEQWVDIGFGIGRIWLCTTHWRDASIVIWPGHGRQPERCVLKTAGEEYQLWPKPEAARGPRLDKLLTRIEDLRQYPGQVYEERAENEMIEAAFALAAAYDKLYRAALALYESVEMDESVGVCLTDRVPSLVLGQVLMEAGR